MPHERPPFFVLGHILVLDTTDLPFALEDVDANRTPPRHGDVSDSAKDRTDNDAGQPLAHTCSTRQRNRHCSHRPALWTGGVVGVSQVVAAGHAQPA